jgi:hypothetical protein
VGQSEKTGPDGRCGKRAEMKGEKITVISRYGAQKRSCTEQKLKYGKPA